MLSFVLDLVLDVVMSIFFSNNNNNHLLTHCVDSDEIDVRAYRADQGTRFITTLLLLSRCCLAVQQSEQLEVDFVV